MTLPSAISYFSTLCPRGQTRAAFPTNIATEFLWVYSFRCQLDKMMNEDTQLDSLYATVNHTISN